MPLCLTRDQDWASLEYYPLLLDKGGRSRQGMAERAIKPLAAHRSSALTRLREWFTRPAKHAVVAASPSSPSPSGKSRTATAAVVPPLDRATVAQWLWGPGYI